MARICTNCIHNNNGWCQAKKTNKDLRNLENCDLKKTEQIVHEETVENKIQKIIELLKIELYTYSMNNEISNHTLTKGKIYGLEIALELLNKG